MSEMAAGADLAVGETVMWADAPYVVRAINGDLVDLAGVAYETTYRSYRCRRPVTVLTSDVRRVGESATRRSASTVQGEAT